MIEVILEIIKQVASYGVFPLLLVIVLVGVGIGAWKLVNILIQFFKKQIETIVQSNSTFAASSAKVSELIAIIAKQSESNVEQLVFIKKCMTKHNYVVRELSNILILVNPQNNPEIKVRLEAIIREIDEPIE